MKSRIVKLGFLVEIGKDIFKRDAKSKNFNIGNPQTSDSIPYSNTTNTRVLMMREMKIEIQVNRS